MTHTIQLNVGILDYVVTPSLSVLNSLSIQDTISRVGWVNSHENAKHYVWILPHIDDEIFALPLFRLGERHSIIYLTQDKSSESSLGKKSRIDELLSTARFISTHTNVSISTHILGIERNIPDSQLHSRLSLELAEDCIKLIEDLNNICLISTNYEGAHQDHDAAAILTRYLGTVLRSPTMYFPTYPRHRFIPTFHTMKRPNNSLSITNSDRIKTTFLALRLMCTYKSQRLTWLGLGIFVIINYLKPKFYFANTLPESLLLDRPFYELRNRARQHSVLDFFTRWASYE